MGSLQDMEVDGVTAFAPPPATSYRYVIELKNSKMSIWMEDRTSKKQWFKGGMAKTDYVSSANAIPDASAADYVKWVAKYTFDLEPVAVERVDILESKLRDQQEEIEKLRGELKGGKAPFLKLTTSQKHGSSVLCWGAVQTDEFISTGLDGKIRVHRGGVYNIGTVVSTAPTGYNQNVQLLKNGTSIQVVYPGYSQGYNSSASLNTIERLDENDEVTISCVCALAETSYLTIVRLGD